MRIRSLFLLSAVALVLLVSGVSSAWAAGPPTAPKDFKTYDFESGLSSFVTSPAIADPSNPPVSAYWGLSSRWAQGGTHSLWCAGTTYPGGLPSSAATYPVGTGGDASAVVTETTDFYEPYVRFSYLMPTKGSQDTFLFRVWGDGQVYTPLNPAPIVSTWTTTKNYSLLSPYGISRTATTLQFRFQDTFEVVGGLGGAIDNIGQGPAVDNVVVSGYKYGPPRNVVTAHNPDNSITLTWDVPFRASGSSVEETRDISYRVWRANEGSTAWTELTSDVSRVTGTTFNDTSAVAGGKYHYIVEAWDAGTGQYYGVWSPEATWPAKATLLTAPSSTWPAAAYTWQSFTTGGTLQPAHAAGTIVQIQCSRNKSTIDKTFNATINSTGTHYSGAVTLPVAGTWYIRARHSDASHFETFSTWTYVGVTGNVILGTPKPATKMTVNHTYSVSGTVKPKQTSASYVKVYAYRWDGKKWVNKTWFKVKLTTSGQPANTSKYTASVKLTSKGTWELRAYHAAHGVEAATYSAYSSKITVK